MSTTVQIDETVYSQTKEALEMALLMLDEENQPPQWTREEAFKAIYAAHQSFSACEPMKARTNTAE